MASAGSLDVWMLAELMVKVDVSSSTNVFFLLFHFPSFMNPFLLLLSISFVLPSPCPSHQHKHAQDRLCSVGDILEGKGGRVYATVGVLLSMAPPLVCLSPRVQLAGFALFYLSVMSVLCAIYVHLAPQV